MYLFTDTMPDWDLQFGFSNVWQINSTSTIFGNPVFLRGFDLKTLLFRNELYFIS